MMALGVGMIVGGAAAALLAGRASAPPRRGASAHARSSIVEQYEPPRWVRAARLSPPARRCRLGHLPTPVERWGVPRAGETEVWIKRDDATGSELSGNKVRKLEFLLADALSSGADSVITVGGVQSNHCRATACASRRLGLDPHIILRVPDGAEAADPGLVGNLMLDRLVGANIHLVGDAEFAEVGGWRLCERLAAKLRGEGRRPYAFPSGGSNPLGTWGYVEAYAEVVEQAEALGVHFDRIYFTCGSGGTAAGLALAHHLAGGATRGTELVGLGVDDDPETFYDKIDAIVGEIQAGFRSREVLRLEQCVGDGYATSTDAELDFVIQVARSTGVVLDPVYTGKGALGMVEDLQARPGARRVVFIHTGGMLGLYAKEAQLEPMLAPFKTNRHF